MRNRRIKLTGQEETMNKTNIKNLVESLSYVEIVVQNVLRDLIGTNFHY